MLQPRIAIVAALEREVWPLVKNWKQVRKEFAGREFEFFENDRLVVVCGGIGTGFARRAAEAVIQLYGPALVVSAGLAGALQADVQVGQVLTPRSVIDAKDGSRTEIGRGEGVLITFSDVADTAQKTKLGQAFGAQAVDMEAAAVARAAEKHGIPFMACKAISDASDFSLPATTNFVSRDGQFQTGKFAVHVALRPWLWKSTLKLARDSAVASRRLCERLAVLANMNTAEVDAMKTPTTVAP